MIHDSFRTRSHSQFVYKVGRSPPFSRTPMLPRLRVYTLPRQLYTLRFKHGGGRRFGGSIESASTGRQRERQSPAAGEEIDRRASASRTRSETRFGSTGARKIAPVPLARIAAARNPLTWLRYASFSKARGPARRLQLARRSGRREETKGGIFPSGSRSSSERRFFEELGRLTKEMRS